MASTLYELVAGRAPFHVEGVDSQLAYLTRIAEFAVPLLGGDPRRDRFLAAALAKDPAQRPPTAASFIDRLSATLDHGGADHAGPAFDNGAGGIELRPPLSSPTVHVPPASAPPPGFEPRERPSFNSTVAAEELVRRPMAQWLAVAAAIALVAGFAGYRLLAGTAADTDPIEIDDEASTTTGQTTVGADDGQRAPSDQTDEVPVPIEPLPDLELTWGIATPSGDLDPLNALTLGDFAVLSQSLEHLTDLDTNGEAVPMLASEFVPSADATSWTFTLRDDVTWHDGTPLSAADVERSLRNLVQGNTLVIGGLIDAVEATDDRTVVVRLTRPEIKLPIYLSTGSPQTAIVPAGGSTDPAGLLVGTGPFRMIERGDTSARFERNTEWWGGPVQVAALELRHFDTVDAANASLRAGEVDGVTR